MLTTEEKRFFASIALGAKELSGCGDKEGAVLIRDRRILSYGYNRKILKNKDFETSAVADALFGVRDLDVRNSALFLTRFPRLGDVKMIVAVGIETIYFFGNIDVPESALLINSLTEESIPLELIRLQ